MFKIFFAYIHWHYTRALLELFGNIKIFLQFLYNFFSIGTLTSTFFSPWLGLGEEYKEGMILNFADHLSSFFVNTMMRLIGVIVRSVVILVGLIAMLCGASLGILFVLIWILYPIIIILLLLSGIRLMFIS